MKTILIISVVFCIIQITFANNISTTLNSNDTTTTITTTTKTPNNYNNRDDDIDKNRVTILYIFGGVALFGICFCLICSCDNKICDGKILGNENRTGVCCKILHICGIECCDDWCVNNDLCYDLCDDCCDDDKCCVFYYSFGMILKCIICILPFGCFEGCYEYGYPEWNWYNRLKNFIYCCGYCCGSDGYYMFYKNNSPKPIRMYKDDIKKYIKTQKAFDNSIKEDLNRTIQFNELKNKYIEETDNITNQPSNDSIIIIPEHIDLNNDAYLNSD